MASTISFKSVGTTVQTMQQNALPSSPVPVGIVTPVRAGVAATDSIFAMTYSTADQVKDNLRNLILTNWGERVGLYDFGANLREMTTEISARADFETEIMTRIKSAVARWMPYVQLQDFALNEDYEDRSAVGAVSFTVTYAVPIMNVVINKLDVVMFIV